MTCNSVLTVDVKPTKKKEESYIRLLSFILEKLDTIHINLTNPCKRDSLHESVHCINGDRFYGQWLEFLTIEHDVAGSILGLQMNIFLCENNSHMIHNLGNFVESKFKDPWHPLLTYKQLA